MPGSYNPPTIQGAIKRQTANYNFLIPVFDAPGWGQALERNFDVADAVLFAITGIANVLGPWENSTVYVIGDRVVDTTNSSLWQNYVNHTSAATDSFEDDRTAHPTYWRPVTSGAVPRGDWVDNTNYNTGEIITDSGRTGIVTESFLSDVSYDSDVTAGHIVTIVDVSAFTTFDAAIVAAANVAVLADPDLFGFVDASDGNALKNVSWAQTKANIKIYADTLYQPLSVVLTATTASFLTSDETKLDAIEALADVTDAGNVGPAISGSAEQTVLEDDNKIAITDNGVLKWFSWETLKSALQTIYGDLFVKTGTVQMCAYSVVDSGYLACDGASYLRTDYAALFTKIGTTWGSVDGTHFNVPDFRDEFLRGSSGTRAVGSTEEDAIENHVHAFTTDSGGTHGHQARYSSTDQAQADGNGAIMLKGSGEANFAAFTGTATGTRGQGIGGVGSQHIHIGTTNNNTGGASETRPHNKTVMYQIKT